MKQCPYCSMECSDDSVFCEKCGKRIKQLCTKCGQENIITSMFCFRCGTELRGITGPLSEVPASTPSFYRPSYQPIQPGMYYQPRRRWTNLTIGDIISKTLNVYQENFKEFYCFALIPAVTTIIMSFITLIIMNLFFWFIDLSTIKDMDDIIDIITNPHFIIVFLTITILTAVINSIAASIARAGVVFTAEDILKEEGKAIDFSSAIQRIRPRILSLIGAEILVSLTIAIVFGGIFIIGIVGFIISIVLITTTGSPIFIFVLLFSLLVLFSSIPILLYLTIMFSFVPQIVVLEGRGAFEALGLSKQRTQGYKWHILIIMFCFGLIQVFVNYFISIPLGIFKIFVGTFLHTFISTVVTNVISALIFPLAIIALTIIYRDSLRMINEREREL